MKLLQVGRCCESVGPNEDELEPGPATVMGVNTAISRHPADTPTTTHQLKYDGAEEREPGALSDQELGGVYLSQVSKILKCKNASAW